MDSPRRSSSGRSSHRIKKENASSTSSSLSNVRSRRAVHRPRSITNTISGSSSSQSLDAGRFPRRSPARFSASLQIQCKLEEVECTSSQLPSPPPTPVHSHSQTYNLPRALPRPVACVSDEDLAACSSDLDGVPIPFIMQCLDELRPRCIQGLNSATPIGHNRNGPLPRLIDFITRDPFAVIPTHVLAVSRSPNDRAILFPVHSVVFATYCAGIRFPEYNPIHEHGCSSSSEGRLISLPVVRTFVPHPETFSMLYAYLYSKNASTLMNSLLPFPVTLSSTTRQSPKYSDLPRLFARTYTSATLLDRARCIHALWTTVVKMGVAESGLWDTMDTAWNIVLGALELTACPLSWNQCM